MPLTNSVLIFIIGISLLVLLERYILGSSQSWTGCRVTSYYGLVQTLVDSGNLFLKTESLGQISCGLIFFCCALFSISFSGQCLVLLFFLSLLSLSLLLATFTSNNSFGLVSYLRVVLVSISFDVVMCFYLFVCIYACFCTFSSTLPLLISFSLMELSRTPYDLLESESELVSSYNIEYGGFSFTLLFLSEYCGFFWILGLFSFLFIAGFSLNSLLLLLLVTVRAVLPRLKFSQVLKLSWSVLNALIFPLILWTWA